MVMGKIIFEQELLHSEVELALLLKRMTIEISYIDIRDFRSNVESILLSLSLTSFVVGCGGSHIWIKRLADNDRWAIIS